VTAATAAPARCLAALLVVACAGCRVERADRSASTGAAGSGAPRGEVWIYTSMYRPILESIDQLARQRLPDVELKWFQSGSEKVAARVDAELAAGGTQADLLVTSDPFFYARLKEEGRFLPYASVNATRLARSLVDLDGHFAACRLSTMVLVHRDDVKDPPRSFRALTEPAWKGRVILGDPLTSGTAFTWSVFLHRLHGPGYFAALRANGAVVAGGNAAVQQKLETGEGSVGVLLLENALAARARGLPLRHLYPEDGAVVIPGFLAVMASTRNRPAATAIYDLLLSPDAQRAMVDVGLMHAADPRPPGPAGEPGVPDLLDRAQPWTEDVLEDGRRRGVEIKADFSRAFEGR
jgi:iron(III) transport system substrate-binding protein